MIRIIIIEDDPTTVLLLKTILKQEIFTIVKNYDNGEDLIKNIKELDADIILMDIFLKGELNGIETSIKIKELKPIPVVYLTTSFYINIIEQANQTQPYGYILKPFENQQLLIAIKYAISKYEIEQQLISSKRFIESVIGNTGDPIAVKNTEKKWMLVNHAFCKILNKSSEFIIGKSSYDLLPIEEANLFDKNDDWVLNNGNECIIEFDFVSPEGDKKFYSIKKTLFEAPNGEKLIINLFRDLTESRKYEEKIHKLNIELNKKVLSQTKALSKAHENLKIRYDELKNAEKIIKNSEESYRSLVNNLPDIVIIHNHDLILFANDIIHELTGFTKEEVIGRTIFESTPKQYKLTIEHNIDKLIKGFKVSPYEIKFVRKDKKIAFFLVRSTQIKYNNKKAILTILTDISAIKEAEEKENLYNTTVNSIKDGIIVIDKELEIVLINEQALENFAGHKFKDYVLGKKITELFPNLKKDTIPNIKLLFKSGTPFVEEQEVEINNKKQILEVTKIPIYEGNEITKIACIYRNITDNKEFQRKLLASIIETEEKERKRIAEDIHDGLGPLLSSIKLYVNEFQNATTDDITTNKMYSYVNELIDEAVINTRNIANNLTPNTINDFGLVKALHSFCVKLKLSNSINITFNADNFSIILDKTTEVILYRIVTELINNTIKHAFASNIDILLHEKNKKITLMYKDDGTGFDYDKVFNNSKGNGLSNIISRAKTVGAEYQFSTQDNNGMYFELKLKY